MERLRERVSIAQAALRTFRKLPLSKPTVDEITRDAAIQRFEYAFEATWKAAQLFLREVEGLIANSPKAVIRSSFQVGLLDERQARLGLQMADDRNLTVHTYDEKLAESIYSRLSSYAELMDHWLKAMEERMVHGGQFEDPDS